MEPTNTIFYNKLSLPYHALYYPIGVARAITHLAHIILIKKVGHFFYSPAQCKLKAKKAEYNLSLVEQDYNIWKCRFAFREYFVTSLAHLPDNYEEYLRAKLLKKQIVKSIKADIRKDTKKPLSTGGFSHLVPKQRACYLLTQDLAFSFLIYPPLFFEKITRYQKGIPAQLAAKQYTLQSFSRNCPSVDPNALTGIMLGFKAKKIGTNKGYEKLEELFTDQKSLLISFFVQNTYHHQISMAIDPKYTFIIDPLIGLLCCENSKRMEMLIKVIEHYPCSGSEGREIWVEKLERIEPVYRKWVYKTGSFTYYFFKNIKDRSVKLL